MSQLACDFFDDASLHEELRRLKDARLDRRVDDERRSPPVDVERQLLEERFLQRARAEVASLAGRAPSDAARFIAWFERLAQDGPGQHDPLFPWLEHDATLEQLRWFLGQEAVGDSGFDGVELDPSIDPVPEAIALANLLAGLTFNRRYAFHAVGALGISELAAPARFAFVDRGLARLGVAVCVRGRRPANTWHEEVITQLVAEKPDWRFAIAEGALMRLIAGARCFEKYRFLFGAPR
ncbi:MAG: iron-containing redox enzyme family protein [Kofleriaceae bacterium]|nr:iron-containing redox enzyme family protein [Kofleriaceae bacterium]